MPRFNISVTFGLTTELEAQFSRFAFDRGDTEVEDFSDESYFSTQSVEADGGSLTFVLTAEDEDSAERIVYESVIYEDMEVEDDNGFTWGVEGISLDIEEVEIPMDVDRATVLVTDYIDSMDGMDDELRAAFGFLLELVKVQRTDLQQLRSEVADRSRELLSVRGELDRLSNGPDGSEAPEDIESIEDRMARLAREDTGSAS